MNKTQDEDQKSSKVKSVKENTQPNQNKLHAKKASISKKPSIIPRETKSSQLLKRKNKLNTSKEEDKKLDSSFTKKKKVVKPKVCNIGQDLAEAEIEVKLPEDLEETKAPKPTPMKRMTMRPNINPYATNY